MQANVTVQLLSTFSAAAGVAVGQLDEGHALLCGPFSPRALLQSRTLVFSPWAEINVKL